MRRELCFLALAVAAGHCASQQKPEQEKYLAVSAPSGYKSWLVQLPSRNNSNNLRIRINIEKEVDVDACQSVWLTLRLDQSVATISGKNHLFLTVKDPRVGATLNACVPAKTERKRARFQSANDLEYDTGTPIMIWAPPELSVFYQVWVPEPQVQAASP